MRVLILSHTRCGSTTLCKWLSKELDIDLDESPYYFKTFNSVFEKNNIIRKIVVEEYFPIKKEIDKFDKVIFLTRTNNIDAAISHIAANNSKEWHIEYEVINEWIEENKIKIINISNYLNTLKRKLNDYSGVHITYENMYINKTDVNLVISYLNIENPKHLDMLDYEKKYRKDTYNLTHDIKRKNLI